jgi:predicted Zn-dependent protease
VLANVVYSGRLPGIQSDQEWRYPPAGYVSEYADLLRLSAASRQESRRLLNSVLKRERTSALAWHVLGDLLWHQHDTAGALLAYRLASCLANSDDHFARSYSDALRGAGREAEGLAWLEARVCILGTSSRAMGPWITWISALEDYGYPERALAASDNALRRHGDASELLAFTVPFLARMGHWEQSENGLQQLGTAGHSPRYHQAAVEFYRMRGDLDLAIESAEQWVRESPQSIQARQQLSESIAKLRGPRAALEVAKRWSLENPGHEQLEEIYYHQLDSISGAWKKDLLLRRRVKRNNEDGWAWRELTFRRLADYEIANQRRRETLQPVITSLLAECDRTAPEAPATLRAHAEWLTVRGEWSQAVAAWLRAIDAEPDRFHSYQRIWDCCATLADSERRAVLQQIESLFLAHPGRLPNARDLVFLIAERFGAGAAEEAAMRWKAQRGDEPELIECAADLLLAEGHGRSDAARALTMLEPAVQRFPYYVGLRLSLADAFSQLGRVAEAEETYREVVRRHPDHTGAHIQLAWVLDRRGDGDQALRLLKSVTARDPVNPALWETRAGILIGNRRFSEARAVLQEGLQKLSDNAQYREKVIQRLLECGDTASAVEMARELVRAYPRGAYIWYILATTLQGTNRFSAPGEIESCYRHSVSLNASLFPAADALTILLVEGHRYEEASGLMRSILPRLGDPSPAQGRLAWIRRQAGQKAQALDEMLAVLRAAPWYRWGWAVVMDWLVEDQAWEKARKLLSPSPPELRTDIRLRSKRLTVLGEAGLQASEIDAEWDALLKDFPENIPLHLERYDSLRAGKRVSEAGAILEPLRLVAPDNPWLLARLVEVLADQQKNAEAVDALLRLWFAAGEVSAWATDYAWKAVERAHLGDECYQKARRRLDQGALPSQEAFSLMVTHAMRGESTKKARQPLWRVWFPGKGAREALALVSLVHNSGRSDRGYEAVVLRNLSRCGYQRLVASLWKKGRTLAESDVYSWSHVGVALINLGRKKQARALLGKWREREGVKMWMVANYLLCFPRGGRKQWQEIRSVCQNALETLPHDHCAKYLAHVHAEMSACLGDTAALRETWTRQQAYFTGKLEQSEWFEGRRQYLLGDIPCAARLLEQNQIKLFNKACKDLRSKRSRLAGSQGRRSGFGGLPWWAWWILLLALQFLRFIDRH